MYTSTLPLGPQLVQLTLDFQCHVGDSHFKRKVQWEWEFFQMRKDDDEMVFFSPIVKCTAVYNILA